VTRIDVRAAVATFSGLGALIVPDGGHLIPDSLADINALVDNQGTIRVAGFDTIGAATGDGITDECDYVIWRMQFGFGPGGAGIGSAVPALEPSSIFIALAAWSALPAVRMYQSLSAVGMPRMTMISTAT
jgi:hypothetical protein